MKTKNITSLLAAIFIYVCLAGCTKDVENHTSPPPPPPPPPPPVQATSSAWFTANWSSGMGGMQFITGATGLSVNFLSNGGKVLVFGKGGSQHPTAIALPSSFDGNYIAFNAGSSELRLFLQGDQLLSPSLEFRYILIASGQQPVPKDLDYTNYQSVCSYYHIPE
jgi:hypothetical protein